MAKTGTTTKTAKKRKFVNFTFDCDDATLNRLNELADLAAVTLSQAISVILAMYVLDMREVKGDIPIINKEVKPKKVNKTKVK